jgi:glycolate oxidase iron-sulfur subunit
MRAVGEGHLANDSASFERHIDRCLGCRACEQVCPAGVEYGQLLEAARGELFQSGPKRGFSYGVLRLVLKHVWLHPARLKFAFATGRLFRDSGMARALRKSGLAKLISSRLEFALALLESSRRKTNLNASSNERRRLAKTSSETSQSDNVFLFAGCVGAGLFSRVNDATARVLEVNGFNVKTPPAQVCCGALHAHAGDLEGARTLARRNIRAFQQNDRNSASVVTNAGGCGAMLASYAHLLAEDAQFAEQARQFSARVRDVSQQLETVEVKQAVNGAGQSVTYDASCHLLYGQHAGEAPLKLLGALGDLKFVKLDGSERCCGGAGIYNLLEPNLSARVLEEKLANIRATGADVLATGNPGCQMQIGAGALLSGMALSVCHPIELIDEAYARGGVYEAVSSKRL